MYLLAISAILYLISFILFLFTNIKGYNLKRPSLLTCIGGLSFYIFYLIYLYSKIGEFPVGDPFGTIAMIGNVTVVIYLILYFFFKREILEFGFVITFVALFSDIMGIPAKTPEYNDPMYTLHIISATVAYSFMFIGGLFSTVRLVIEKQLKEKRMGKFHTPISFLRSMERISVNSAFVALTLTLIFGSFWAREFFGKHWIDDLKLIITMVIWFFYAFLVHPYSRKSLGPYRYSLLILLGALGALLNLVFIRHSF